MNDKPVAPLATKVERCTYRPVIGLGEGPDSFIYIEPMAGGDEASALRDEEVLKLGSVDKTPNIRLLGGNARTTIRLAIRRVEELIADGVMSCVIIPVHAACLLNKEGAAQLTDECRGLPPEVRDRMVFEVVGLMERFKQSYADDIAIVLYSFCRFYTARISPAVDDFKLLTTCNFSGAAIDLADKPWPDKVIRPALASFVEKATRNRLTTFLHRVGAPHILELARELGVDYVDGEAC